MEFETLLEKFRISAADVNLEPGFFVNFLGLKTKTDYFPHAAQAGFDGNFIDRLPIPDDGVYGGAGEYASLLTAIDSAGETRANAC